PHAPAARPSRRIMSACRWRMSRYDERGDIACFGRCGAGPERAARDVEEWVCRPIDLSEWIDTGGAILGPLRDPGVFGSPPVADYGASIAWGDDDDLRIDAVHLERI